MTSDQRLGCVCGGGMYVIIIFMGHEFINNNQQHQNLLWESPSNPTHHLISMKQTSRVGWSGLRVVFLFFFA